MLKPFVYSRDLYDLPDRYSRDQDSESDRSPSPKNRSRLRDCSRDRHKESDRSRLRDRSKDRHRESDRSRLRDRSKDRQRESDRSRLRDRSKDRHRESDRSRLRDRSRDRNKENSSPSRQSRRPDHGNSQSSPRYHRSKSTQRESHQTQTEERLLLVDELSENDKNRPKSSRLASLKEAIFGSITSPSTSSSTRQRAEGKLVDSVSEDDTDEEPFRAIQPSAHVLDDDQDSDIAQAVDIGNESKENENQKNVPGMYRLELFTQH